MDDSGGTRRTEREGEVAGSTRMEPSTLQWTRDRETGGQTGKGDRVSVRSGEAASCTESEKELMADGGGEGGGADEKKGTGLIDDGDTHLEEPVENHLPEKAAQVFNPAVNVLPSPSTHKESETFWEMQSERSPFLGPRGVPQDYNQHSFQYDWTEDAPPARCKYTCLSHLSSPVCPHLSIPVFTCPRWTGLFQQECPEGRCVVDDIRTPLPLPGVGGVCVSAI